MTSDAELLREYAQTRCEQAFRELVDRHLNLVYSAALRQVRVPQLAEEVAQQVFVELSQAARRLRPGTVLCAWLYQIARRTAIDVVRRETRRQAREKTATEMNALNGPGEWTQVEPLLDEAMAALDETDRTAVLLRYFENKSLREVGHLLGTSEDAAQKRASRAVERLREFFAKRGVAVGAGGLVVVLSANAVQAAPLGLAGTISAAALLTGAAIETSTLAAASKAITMTTLQKTVVATTVAVLAGAGMFQAHQNSQLRGTVETLRQQQAPLSNQIQQAESERNRAVAELAELKSQASGSKQGQSDLLRLRGDVTRLSNSSAELAKENEDLKREVSTLEGRWRNVTNSPQFSLPYLKRNEWSSVYGTGDPMEVFLSAASAARDGDSEKLNDLLTGTNSTPLFSSKRWAGVQGIQVVSVNTILNPTTGEETAMVNTLLLKDNGMETRADQPPALQELIRTSPEIHRWFLVKTDTGWKISGSN